MPGLDRLVENRFDLGTWRSGAADLEPEGSAYQIVGLLGDDGLPYRRGGSTFKSTTALDTGLLWVADAALVGGRRTMLGSGTHFSALGADDVTPGILAPRTYSKPHRAAVVTGAAFVAAGPAIYAGSRKESSYGPVTATLTNGSRVVTGTTTSFLANVDVGMILHEDTGGHSVGVVQEVGSDTGLLLAWPWPGADAVATVTFNSSRDISNSETVTALGTVGAASSVFASVANRLVVAYGNKASFSTAGDPTMFDSADFHLFPTDIAALGSLRDVLLVFTTSGVWAVSNLAYNLTDANGNVQHRRELVNADLIAWGHEGIAPWAGSLVVPALDGVWLMDTLGAPTKISQPVTDLYLSYVRAGYRTGVAEVFNGHYLLPILTSGNVWVDTLVCKLTPSRAGATFAWSQLSGQGAEVAGFAERAVSPPKLLGASTRAVSKVLDLTGYFSPSSSVKEDADGTDHPFQVTTRNIPTGGLVTNAVLFMQAVYTLTDAASDDPVLTAEVSADGGAWQTLAGSAGEGTPASPYTWPVHVAARHIRVRLTSTLAASEAKLEVLQLFCRKSGTYLT